MSDKKTSWSVRLFDFLSRNFDISSQLSYQMGLRASQLRKQDEAMKPVLKKLAMKREKTMLESKCEASLQLAFQGSLNLVFYDGDNRGVGTFVISNEDTNSMNYMTVYIHILEHQSPHLYFDNKRNNHRFRRNFPEKLSKAELVTCDGYFSDRFNLYAPPGYAIDSLVVGAPDVLDAIERLNMGADVEVLGSQLYMIFPNDVNLPDIMEQLIANGKELAKEFDDNLSRYKDDRAVSFSQPIGYEGQRLIRK